jgi:hypothetical protein
LAGNEGKQGHCPATFERHRRLFQERAGAHIEIAIAFVVSPTMAFALRHAGAMPLGARSRQQSTLRTPQQHRPLSSSSGDLRRLKVAAIDQPTTYSDAEQPHASLAEPVEQQQLEIAELDQAQESLLKWMLFLDSDQQEADLDEMEDLEEVGDEEHADLYDEVETMLEESESSFKVGDKVYGTVYEVDDDGAYVEIGAKSAGFVPLVECALGKLKTVRVFDRTSTARYGGSAVRGPAHALHLTGC